MYGELSEEETLSNYFNMKIYSVLIFLSVFSSGNVFGQLDSTLIQQVTQFKYSYQTKRYNKKELGRIIYSDTVAFDSYKKFRKLNSAAGISFGASLLSFAFAANRADSDCGGDDVCEGAFIFSIVGAATSLTAGVIFLSSRIKFYKSVRLFNEGIQATNKIGRSPMELNLNYTGNGLGVLLYF